MIIYNNDNNDNSALESDLLGRRRQRHLGLGDVI